MTLFLCLLLYCQLCVDVHDGDTLRLDDGRRIRLWGIDCPELKQPGGHEARNFLRNLVLKKQVRLEPHGEDRYGRTLAVVIVGPTRCNEALLRAGWAWWYRKYTPSARDYEALELAARRQRVGIWASGVAVAPWEFRHPQR